MFAVAAVKLTGKLRITNRDYLPGYSNPQSEDYNSFSNEFCTTVSVLLHSWPLVFDTGWIFILVGCSSTVYLMVAISSASSHLPARSLTLGKAEFSPISIWLSVPVCQYMTVSTCMSVLICQYMTASTCLLVLDCQYVILSASLTVNMPDAALMLLWLSCSDGSIVVSYEVDFDGTGLSSGDTLNAAKERLTSVFTNSSLGE